MKLLIVMKGMKKMRMKPLQEPLAHVKMSHNHHKAPSPPSEHVPFQPEAGDVCLNNPDPQGINLEIWAMMMMMMMVMITMMMKLWVVVIKAKRVPRAAVPQSPAPPQLKHRLHRPNYPNQQFLHRKPPHVQFHHPPKPPPPKPPPPPPPQITAVSQ